MKVIQYMGPDKIQVSDIPKPKVSGNEVLIKVLYSGICGTDMAISAGKHPRAKARLTMGHEFSGEIVEKGDKVSEEWEIGKQVTANPLITCGKCWSCRNGQEQACYTLNLFGIDAPGSFAEYILLPESSLHALPEGVDVAKAALIEPLAVGMHALTMGQSESTDRVLVIGAGPIGIITALCLKNSGVNKLLISDVSPERLERARACGLEAIDAANDDVTKKVMDMTNNEGVDVIYEVSGHESAIPDLCNWIRVQGRIVFVSVHKDARPMDFRSVNFKEITIVGSRCYGQADFVKAVALCNDFPLEKLISHKISIEDGIKGFDLMKNPAESCKVLIKMEG